MSLAAHCIVPDWPAPPNVRALQTTRAGGVSSGEYASLNLGTHAGDDPIRVAANRQRLSGLLPSEPIWLEQVHGTRVVHAEQASCVPQADACVAHQASAVCAIMTADCLPVLLCDDAGTVVGAAHAGWRGLAAGVIEATLAEMRCDPVRVVAWLGPAIGPQAFEVGDEVMQAFLACDKDAESAFVPHGPGKWLADIYLLASQRLRGAGVTRIHYEPFCTYSDAGRFYSYRRDGVTGRMASLIWLAE